MEDRRHWSGKEVRLRRCGGPARLTQAEYIAFLDSLPVQPSSLFFASKDGNVEEVMRILSNNPTLDVKWRNESEESETALHVVCAGGRDSVVSILLAHPNVDVNATDKYGYTPFMSACERGHTSCARLMLRDSRVKVNEPDNGKRTTLFRAAATSRLNVIRWWIASGREIDLGKPGDGCHWDGREEWQDRSGNPAGEIQGESGGNQTCDETGYPLVRRSSCRDVRPGWSLSRMDYCKPKTPLPLLQPGSSPLPPSFLWNSKWCCAIVW